MKIVVVSDSHRDVATLETIVNKTSADLYLHAGDSAMPEQLIKPFISVRGNCDVYPYEVSKIIELQGLRIYMTHGHRYSKVRMIKTAKAKHCHIAVSGHTHIPSIEKIDDIYVINPGSVSFPRGNHQRSYIEISYDDVENIDIKIVEIKHEPTPEN